MNQIYFYRMAYSHPFFQFLGIFHRNVRKNKYFRIIMLSLMETGVPEEFMRCTRYFRFFTLAAFLAVGLLGCNIFNPFESERIDDSDTDALVYEGYENIRKAEYTLAAEHFSKAISVDSSKSEAWYGLAKAVLNQYNLNVFEMLKYAKTEGQSNGFMEMDDASALKYRTGIDTVLKILDKFIERDTTGRTDKRVRFTNFTTSYTVLQLVNVAILIRDTKSNMTKLFNYDHATGQINLEWNEIEKLADTAAVTTITALASSAQALKADPDNTVPIFRNFVPEADTMTDEELEGSTLAVADQIIEMSEILNKNANRTDVFIKVGNYMDDDGDGCVDEEIWDGQDNDGDGEIDEDLRASATYVFRASWTERTIESLMIPEGSPYETLDIDGNNIGKEEAEWAFLYTTPEERAMNKDYRLKFTYNLSFIADQNGDKIHNKELVRQDTDIYHLKYDLDWRKANVGGCWVNYTETDFLKWFEGRM